jgi:hypothetical protein
VNSDGRLSDTEWESADRPAEVLEAMDTNANGFLDPAEVEAGVAPARSN